VSSFAAWLAAAIVAVYTPRIGASFDRDEGFAAYRRCYGDGIRGHAAFSDLGRRAQAIVDALAADGGAKR
jgi:hypothetical protein